MVKLPRDELGGIFVSRIRTMKFPHRVVDFHGAGIFFQPLRDSRPLRWNGLELSIASDARHEDRSFQIFQNS